MMQAQSAAVFLTAAAVLLSWPAAAVDVINADSHPHTVVVEEWGETLSFTIGPRTTLNNVCLICRVGVPSAGGGGPGINAEDNEVVVIRNGIPRVGG